MGIRALRAHLSRYLRVVRDGEIVQFTDRGHVVAELRLPEQGVRDDREVRLQRLVAEGRVVPPLSCREVDWTQCRGLGLPQGYSLQILDDLCDEAVERPDC